jgi:hypothetical protein
MMILIGVVACVLWVFRTFGWSVVAAVVWLPVLVLVMRLLQGHPRLSAWVLAASSVLANSSIAFIIAYFYSRGGLVLMFLASTLFVPLVIGSGITWAKSRTVSQCISRSTAWVVVWFLVMLPISMMGTHWPLYLAFKVSRPAMDRLADRVARGETLTSPEQAGLYWIIMAKKEPSNSNVALIFDDDPAGMSGFVRFGDLLSESGPMTNLNFNISVGDRWFYQNED